MASNDSTSDGAIDQYGADGIKGFVSVLIVWVASKRFFGWGVRDSFLQDIATLYFVHATTIQWCTRRVKHELAHIFDLVLTVWLSTRFKTGLTSDVAVTSVICLAFFALYHVRLLQLGEHPYQALLRKLFLSSSKNSHDFDSNTNSSATIKQLLSQLRKDISGWSTETSHPPHLLPFYYSIQTIAQVAMAATKNIFRSTLSYENGDLAAMFANTKRAQIFNKPTPKKPAHLKSTRVADKINVKFPPPSPGMQQQLDVNIPAWKGFSKAEEVRSQVKPITRQPMTPEVAPQQTVVRMPPPQQVTPRTEPAKQPKLNVQANHFIPATQVQPAARGHAAHHTHARGKQSQSKIADKRVQRNQSTVTAVRRPQPAFAFKVDQPESHEDFKSMDIATKKAAWGSFSGAAHAKDFMASVKHMTKTQDYRAKKAEGETAGPLEIADEMVFRPRVTAEERRRQRAEKLAAATKPAREVKVDVAAKVAGEQKKENVAVATDGGNSLKHVFVFMK